MSKTFDYENICVSFCNNKTYIWVTGSVLKDILDKRTKHAQVGLEESYYIDDDYKVYVSVSFLNKLVKGDTYVEIKGDVEEAIMKELIKDLDEHNNYEDVTHKSNSEAYVDGNIVFKLLNTEKIEQSTKEKLEKPSKRRAPKVAFLFKKAYDDGEYMVETFWGNRIDIGTIMNNYSSCTLLASGTIYDNDSFVSAFVKEIDSHVEWISSKPKVSDHKTANFELYDIAEISLVKIFYDVVLEHM